MISRLYDSWRKWVVYIVHPKSLEQWEHIQRSAELSFSTVRGWKSKGVLFRMGVDGAARGTGLIARCRFLQRRCGIVYSGLTSTLMLPRLGEFAAQVEVVQRSAVAVVLLRVVVPRCRAGTPLHDGECREQAQSEAPLPQYDEWSRSMNSSTCGSCKNGNVR